MTNEHEVARIWKEATVVARRVPNGTEMNHEQSVRAEIWTWDFQNTKEEFYLIYIPSGNYVYHLR
jgi:hypothetical protein